MLPVLLGRGADRRWDFGASYRYRLSGDLVFCKVVAVRMIALYTISHTETEHQHADNAARSFGLHGTFLSLSSFL